MFLVVIALVSLTGSIYIWTAAPVVVDGVLNWTRLFIHIGGSLFVVGLNVLNFFGMRPAFRRDIV